MLLAHKISILKLFADTCYRLSTIIQTDTLTAPWQNLTWTIIGKSKQSLILLYWVRTVQILLWSLFTEALHVSVLQQIFDVLLKYLIAIIKNEIKISSTIVNSPHGSQGVQLWTGGTRERPWPSGPSSQTPCCQLVAIRLLKY